ncbi:MAG TPA: hypothetical protein VNZ53_31830 [Steroidobacteraceae bacterium]|nr:hypothetical protein [Steroidobacteraceae bacterium]
MHGITSFGFRNSIAHGHNKTKLYRLHNPDLTRWQEGLRMTKNGDDAVGLVGESGGADSAAHSPLQAKLSLARGDRVQMSALGRARHPSYGDVQGLVVGQGSPNSWRIKFDERKHVQTIHSDYLEKVGELSPASLVDVTVSKERSNHAVTLPVEPASPRKDRWQPGHHRK